MNNHSRHKLWVLSMVKPLFRQELINLLEKSNEEQRFDLLIYCYEKYSDMHPEVLLEVFARYHENKSTGLNTGENLVTSISN
jgi:hypothetical protein